MKSYRKKIWVSFLALLLLGLSGFKDKNIETTPYQFPTLKFFPEMPVSINNPVSVEGATLGRYLFYDPILSADSTISCASCHRQEVAFSDSPNRLSMGIDGKSTFRHSMPLFNLAWYPSMFWDGKSTSIEDQVFHPLNADNEMNLQWKDATQRIQNSEFYQPMFKAAFGKEEIDSLLIAKAIGQFERTLISNNSRYDKVLKGETYFSIQEYEGFLLMNDQTKGNCLHCHTTDGNALGTTAKFSNNGLDPIFDPQNYSDKGKGEISGKTADFGLFRIPSLRNIVVTAPYMHDGRFETLEEVLNFYSEEVNNCSNIDSKMGFAHQGGVHLTKDEKEKIIVFLHTLTDSIFLTNPEFGNPFITGKMNNK